MNSGPVVSKSGKYRVASARIDAHKGCDHPIGRGHRSALLERYAHVSPKASAGASVEGRPVGKTVTPGGYALLQARRPSGRGEFSRLRRRSRNCRRRQMPALHRSHEPGDHSGVWRLAQRLRDDDVNVEVDQSSRPGLIFRFSRMTTPRSRAAIVVRKARIESGWRLAPGLANFISFGRAFYDNGDGPMFTSRQATRQFASLGATPQEQGFGHAGDP